MIILHKYIFAKAYYFCIQVFKEKDFPWFFASGAVSISIVNNVFIIEGVLRIVNLNIIDISSEYYGFFSLLMLIFISARMKKNNKYLGVLADCKRITIRKRIILRYVSIVYIILQSIALIWVSTIIRISNGG
jgi:hypothetical protein